jgi:hypothetical protein
VTRVSSFLDGIAEHVERQLQDGRTFVLDAPTTVPAWWGVDSDVLAPQGESLIVTGPQGVGKSTLVQQLALARAGIIEPELLGFPVRPDLDRCVLYLAADRPQQIARSFRRMVTDEHAEGLGSRLKVWKGPLPFDLVQQPGSARHARARAWRRDGVHRQPEGRRVAALGRQCRLSSQPRGRRVDCHRDRSRLRPSHAEGDL